MSNIVEKYLRESAVGAYVASQMLQRATDKSSRAGWGSGASIHIQKRASDNKILKRLTMKSARPNDPMWVEWVASEANVSPKYVMQLIKDLEQYESDED
jgi:hypothetical protein